jgi:hypothetical protein
MLLSELQGEGVVFGLDSEAENLQTTHPPRGAVGFFVAAISFLFSLIGD